MEKMLIYLCYYIGRLFSKYTCYLCNPYGKVIYLDSNRPLHISSLLGVSIRQDH